MRHLNAIMTAATLVLAAAGAGASGLQYTGYAYDLETGELVYTEVHEERSLAEGVTRMDSTYRDPGGAAFARRSVWFEGLDPDPDFEMVDERSDYAEGARDQGEEVLVYKREEGERAEKTVAPKDRPLVVDAGFDRFIQREWERLQAGEFARFDFVNADRLSLIGLRLSKRASVDTPHGAASQFEMEPNNWLIRLLVDPLVITYLDETRSLYEYQGISNVKRPGSGLSNYVVRIEFPPEERVQAASAVAAAEPGR